MMGYDLNTTEATAGRMTLDAKLASQIGDDVQHKFDHEALFQEARAELARLSATVADLTAKLAKTRRNLETANHQVDRLLALSNSMDDDFKARDAEWRSAIEALGAMPEGYCFCSENRIGDDSKIHEPECRDIRAILCACDEGSKK